MKVSALVALALTLTVSLSASAAVVATIPSDLAADYMTEVEALLERSPQADASFIDDGVTQTLRFKDIGDGFRTEQVCTRNLATNTTKCVIRDFNELGSVAGSTVTLRRFSGILWDLMPVAATNGTWGEKKYKNLVCQVSIWSTGFCTAGR